MWTFFFSTLPRVSEEGMVVVGTTCRVLFCGHWEVETNSKKSDTNDPEGKYVNKFNQIKKVF